MGKVDPHQVHEEERLLQRKWVASKYYDYPDGEDLLGKLSFTNKIAFFSTALYGVVRTVSRPAPTTVSGKLLRIAQVVVPAMGMATTFTCVTYFATNIRKKDDPINYMLGGAAAGALLGPALGNAAYGFWGAFYGMLIGGAKKNAQLEGRVLVPIIHREYLSSYMLRKVDTSFFEDKKDGNWTKDPPK